MAVYEYVCGECGRFDIRLAIGTAPDQRACPVCAQPARRAFSPPMLGQVSKPERTLLENAERTRDAPDVVTEVPPRTARPAPAPHPALAKLPRP